MGLPDNEQNIYTSGNFFHVLPVESMIDFNPLSSREPKLGVERILTEETGFFPDSIITTRNIVPIADICTVKKILLEGIDKKFSMGVRSVANIQTQQYRLPWDMEITTEEKVEKFIHQTLPEWMNITQEKDRDITHLILMNNLPEIGTKKSNKYQFVARLRWDTYDNSLNTQLMLEMAVKTNKLRSLDDQMDKGHDNLIRYMSTYSPTHNCLDATLYIGAENLYSSHMNTSQKFSLHSPFVVSEYSQSIMKPEARDAVTTMFGFLREASTNPSIQLFDRLANVSSMGLSDTEYQGYANGKTNNYIIRMYGLRGVKDETNSGQQPRIFDHYPHNIPLK